MVRKRSEPLTDDEVRALALRVYKDADPEEGPMDFQVAQLLDDEDLDLAAHNREDGGEAPILAQAEVLWMVGHGQEPADPRTLRQAAGEAARRTGGQELRRWHVMDALEAMGKLPCPEQDVVTTTRLALDTEVFTFVPPVEPVHMADTVNEVMDRLTYEQVWDLAEAALEVAAVCGSDLEWSSDHIEWVAEELKKKLPAGLPAVSDQDPGAANWWRRLQGGRNPVDEDGMELPYEPGFDAPEDFEPPMWWPKTP